MSKGRKKECINCLWWDSLIDDGEEEEGCGQCHYSAPPARLCFDEVMAANPNIEDICAYTVKWPFTAGKDWCSKFKLN